MAVLRWSPVSLMLVLSCCNFAFVANSAQSLHARRPSVVFAFGDSLTDLGIGLRMFNPNLMFSGFQPYGRTYFGQGAGRYTDGRVLIDCIVQSLGLSFLNPFFDFVGTDFSNGASYAVAASSALDYTTMVALGGASTTRYTLEDQLQWHLTFLLYAEAGINGVTRFPTMSAISESLYFISIGAIDVMYGLSIDVMYGSSEMARNVTQLVMVKITETVQVLYEHGARNFLLASTQYFGCMPSLKFFFKDLDVDDRGCLPTVNDVIRNFSTSLAALSQSLRETLPDVRIAFLDTLSAFEEVFSYPDRYGIIDTLNACCAASTTIPATAVGNGYTINNPCGPMSRVCKDPNTFMNWDGEHYTDNTYRQVVNMFIEGKFIMPSDALSRFGAVPLGKA